MNEAKTKFNNYTPEELSELYKENPDLFDELAADAIRQAYLGITPEQTLKRRQIQWTIDAKLRKGKTPLERMHIMESIFYGQVFGDGGQLDHLISSCTQFICAVRGTKYIHHKKPKIYLLKKQ